MLILSWLVAPSRAQELAGLAEAAGLYLAGSCLPPRVACPRPDRPRSGAPAKWR